MSVFKQFLTFFIPERCVICGRVILEQYNFYPLCYKCESQIKPKKNKFCSICSYPLISETNKCLRCRATNFNFINNRALFAYSGKIKELIYQYKFSNRRAISFYFGKLLSNILIEKYSEIIIVPVPGRKIVKKEKGWEHLDFISTILKKKYKLQVQKLLTRKGKKAQKTLTREKRAENLRKSIRIQRNIRKIPETVVLLDDIYTTGTTINECAGILKDAGVKEIFSLTIAID